MGNKVIEASAHRDPHQDYIETAFRWGVRAPSKPDLDGAFI